MGSITLVSNPGFVLTLQTSFDLIPKVKLESSWLHTRQQEGGKEIAQNPIYMYSATNLCKFHKSASLYYLYCSLLVYMSGFLLILCLLVCPGLCQWIVKTWFITHVLVLRHPPSDLWNLPRQWSSCLIQSQLCYPLPVGLYASFW